MFDSMKLRNTLVSLVIADAVIGVFSQGYVLQILLSVTLMVWVMFTCYLPLELPKRLKDEVKEKMKEGDLESLIREYTENEHFAFAAHYLFGLSPREFLRVVRIVTEARYNNDQTVLARASEFMRRARNK